jgi:predicted permease
MYGQFLVLFALIFTGYALKKTGVIGQGMADGLHSFITWFAFPCLLVYKIGTLQASPGLTGKLLTVIALSVCTFAVYVLVSRIFIRLLRYPARVAPVAEVSMTAPNNGFMGFPIALLFFGQQGLFLMVGHNIALNLYTFTYGLARLSKTKAEKAGAWTKVRQATVRLLLNPNILAMFAGFALYLAQVPMDNPFGTYLESLAGLATPLAMMFIGVTLAGSNVLDLFKNRVVWESAAVKVLVLPAVVLGLVYFLPLDPLVKGILVIASALPTAAIVSVISGQQGQDALMASKIIFFSTVLSMGTIPLWMNLLHLTLPL